MAVSRRTTLKGMGVLLGGGSLETLRSAATDVNHSRGVRVEFVADDAANLQITPARESKGIEFGETADGAVTVSFSNINRSARTRFEELFEFTNNSTNTITAIEASVNDVSGNGDISAGGIAETAIQPGESQNGLAITINTVDRDGFTGEPDVEATVTIRVETDS